MDDNQAQQCDMDAVMQSAVQQAVGSIFPGDMVTRFIAIVETLDGDSGDRALIVSATPHMKTWDALGLLHYSLQQEQASAVHDMWTEDD